MKRCCTSICLVREWYVELFASAMHPWLSHMMDIGPSYTYPTSTKSCLRQTASFIQWSMAMYSASVVDNVMVGCFLHFHEMNLMPTKNTFPMVDSRSYASPPQFALQNPLKAISLPLRHNVKSKVSFKIPHDAFYGYQLRWSNLRHRLAYCNHLR